MSRILITGGAGFIGSHTADALIDAGHYVRVLDFLDPQVHGKQPEPLEKREFPAYMHPAVDCFKGDVRDPEQVSRALQDIDVVYHFAAFTGVGQSMYDIRSYVDTNCTGTATLLEALIKRDGPPLKRLILSSSRAVYGEGSHHCEQHGTVYPTARDRAAMGHGDFAVHCPQCNASVESIATTEERDLAPLSIYGMTKLQQEQQCQQVAASFSLPVTILRYFNVYGSRQSLKNPYTGVASIFYSRVQAGEPLFLYEYGTPGRDFVHVADVVRANLLAMDAEVPPGACFNIGTGINASIADIARALAESAGQTADIRITGEFRVGDIHACYADLTKSGSELAYKPQVSLQEGMSEFARWASGEQFRDLYQQSRAELERHNLIGCAEN